MHPQAKRARPMIAIVEDDAPTRDLFCEILTEEGYQMLCCATASQAHRRIRQEEPDLTILDVHLEGSESGLTVLEILRLTPATSMLPILVCSVDTTLLKEKAYEFARAHCEVLAKPFDVDAFVDTVRAMLGRPRQRRSHSLTVRTAPVTLRAAKRLSQHESSGADAASTVPVAVAAAFRWPRLSPKTGKSVRRQRGREYLRRLEGAGVPADASQHVTHARDEEGDGPA